MRSNDRPWKCLPAPEYPREKAISEATAKTGMVRLMYPLYMTRQCLDCHGEPKGTLDKTGYPREGLRLGQNAGAISVAIPYVTMKQTYTRLSLPYWSGQALPGPLTVRLLRPNGRQGPASSSIPMGMCSPRIMSLPTRAGWSS